MRILRIKFHIKMDLCAQVRSSRTLFDKMFTLAYSMILQSKINWIADIDPLNSEKLHLICCSIFTSPTGIWSKAHLNNVMIKWTQNIQELHLVANLVWYLHKSLANICPCSDVVLQVHCKLKRWIKEKLCF